jgi:hypothetical protein
MQAQLKEIQEIQTKLAAALEPIEEALIPWIEYRGFNSERCPISEIEIGPERVSFKVYDRGENETESVRRNYFDNPESYIKHDKDERERKAMEKEERKLSLRHQEYLRLKAEFEK